MAKIAVWLINFYQKYLSPDTRAFFKRRNPTCVFYPTCSEYSKQAFLKYGFLKGLALSVKRIAKCHPWQKEHFDPLS